MSRQVSKVKPSVKIHFVSYGDSKFIKSRKRIAKEAHDIGLFDSIHIYTEADRDRWFSEADPNVKRVVEKKRGGGYWLWKAFCILYY